MRGFTDTILKRGAQRWRPSRATMRLRLYALLLLSDCAAIASGFATANVLIGRHFLASPGLLSIALILPAFGAVAFYSRAYSVMTALRPWHSLARGGRALAIAAIAVVVAAFLLKGAEALSRLTLTAGLLISFLLLASARAMIARRATTILGGSPWDVMVICDGLPNKFPSDSSLYFDSSDLTPEVHTPEMFDRLGRAIGQVDRVLVHCLPERRHIWAAVLRGTNVQGEIFMEELNAFAPLGVSTHHGQSTLVIARGPLALTDRVLKRALDLIVSFLMLATLAPLLIVITVAVRLTSPGPVLFIQSRIGRQNRLFPMLKFRTMRVDAADGEGTVSTQRDDQRITPVGKFLRRTSLDELPQLLNVVRGEMSVVGPRPHATGSTAADLLFWEVNPRYWDRHAIKPGLTGLAQVRGFRGATPQRSDLESRLTADLEYIEGWSIWLDISILLRTIAVTVHRNAY